MSDQETPPPESLESAPAPSQPDPIRRILVVHDDNDLRQLSAEVLVRSGFEVHAAADGEAAWRALNDSSYDLVITSHKMPKVTGLQLLEKLHAVRKLQPVIMAAPSLPREEFIRSPWLHPAAMLLMPYTVTEFLKTVQEVLCGGNPIR